MHTAVIFILGVIAGWAVTFWFASKVYIHNHLQTLIAVESTTLCHECRTAIDDAMGWKR